jgi:hypothetical protein
MATRFKTFPLKDLPCRLVPADNIPQETQSSRKHGEAEARYATGDSKVDRYAAPSFPYVTIPTSVTYRPYTFVRSLGCRPVRGSIVHQLIQPWRTLALPGT